MSEKSLENNTPFKLPKLPIRPMELDKTYQVKEIPIADIISGVHEDQSTVLPEAIVAYFDILGFSGKSNAADLKRTLADFAGPWVEPARTFKHVRFNIFSDCAFVAAPIEKAADLLSSIRYAFLQWTADGILVRGGIGLGTYTQNRSVVHDIATENLFWSYFSGSAVVEANKYESMGKGALLFSSNACADFLARKFAEPVFTFGHHKIIGWSDDEDTLSNFMGVSLLRLIKILSTNDFNCHPAVVHLIANIRYSLAATDKDLMWLYILGVLSLPNLEPVAKKRALQMLQITDLDIFTTFKESIEIFLKNKQLIKYWTLLADFDSSISGSIFSK
jgi:hypothetical protein